MMGENNNRPYVPRGWLWTKLDDFAGIVLGQSPPSSTYNEDGDGLPFFQGKLEFGSIYPTTRKWCSLPKKIAEKGDVLVSVRAPVGPTNICPVKACIGRGLAAIRPLAGMQGLFLLYLMRAFENDLTGKGTGTTFSAVTGDQLKEFDVPLPPLPEQHRIVAKMEELFSDLDAGVAALKRVKANLKRYRQAVLKAAFEGKLTAEWREEHKGELEPASVLLERIKEERRKKGKKGYKEFAQVDTSQLPDLPEGWVWTTTSEVCSSVRDGTHDTPKYTQNGVPLVTSKNLKEHNIDFTTAKNISIEDHAAISVRSGVDRGDILFAMIGTIGNPAVVRTDKVFSIKNVALFKENQTVILSEYLKFWLESPVFGELLEKLELLKGTTQKFIPLEHLRILPVPFVSLREQEIILQEIESMLSIADEVEQTVELSLKRAVRLRQSILKIAFEGKLVQQDPTDEPASVLLERIKQEKAKMTVGNQRLGKKKSAASQGVAK